jgi:hypothetical protein
MKACVGFIPRREPELLNKFAFIPLGRPFVTGARLSKPMVSL